MKAYLEPQEVGRVTATGFEIISKPGLEAWTGADAIFTRIPLPLLPTTLDKHLEQGALVVQIKRGTDFSSSIIDGRINHALARMKTVVPHAAQRIILFQGYATSNDKGELLINNRLVNIGYERVMKYDTYAAEVLKIAGRGGTLVQLLDKDIGGWAQVGIKTMREMKQGEKIIFPDGKKREEFFDPENPLQDLRLIPDAWLFLAALPGVGPKMVTKLVATYGANYATMLEELTNPHLESAVGGIGKGKIMEIRRALNLRPWESIGAKVDQALFLQHCEDEITEEG